MSIHSSPLPDTSPLLAALTGSRLRRPLLFVTAVETDARTMERLLRRCAELPDRLLHAVDGDEACRILAESGASCALVDLRTEYAAGIDAVERIRAAAAYMPVVALTEEHDDQRGLLALRHGAQDYVDGGWDDPHVLLLAIRSALERQWADLEVRTAEVLRAESGTLTRAILDSLDTRAAAIDPQGTVISANQPWLRHAGGSDLDPGRAEVGANYLELCERAAAAGTQDLAIAAAGVRGVLEGRSTRCQLDYRLAGSNQWHTLTVLPLAGAPGAVVSHLDITERKAQELQLATVAFHDSLTGLPNRDLFYDRLNLAALQGRRRHLPLAVFFIDIDHFKTINDTLGHECGDIVLRTVADRLAGAVRPGDTVARFGGDEFTVLCEGVADRVQAEVVAGRLVASMVPPITVRGRELDVQASIGATLASSIVEDVELLVQEADTAMYRAKELGRGRVEFFEEGLRRRARERMRLGNDLQQALEQTQFTLAYQPVVSLTTGRIMAAEALLRWQPEGRDPISPAAFVPLAEERGLIEPIGRWVLTNACTEMLRVHDGRRPVLGLSVNLSGAQLASPQLHADVARALTVTGWRGADLCLEITETALTRDIVAAASNLDAVRKLGVRVALDDFGTGYSSLLYAKHFNVDVIKIDKAFVDGLGLNGADTAIVRSVVSLAHSLGARVVAEGVQSAEQIAELRSLGCDAAQGYYFARPLALAPFTALCGREQRLWERSRRP